MVFEKNGKNEEHHKDIRHPSPYSEADVRKASESIMHAQGYEGKGLEAYAHGLAIPIQTFREFEGLRVLDLGAGAHLQFARGLENAGIHADVTSFSQAFADPRWRDNINGLKPTDKIVAGMAEHLDFDDESFDRIVCLNLVEHLRTYERYILSLQEMARVLAPGGIGYIGPTREGGKGPATVIPNAELEQLLNQTTQVSYHEAHRLLKFQTLVLTKKSHA